MDFKNAKIYFCLAALLLVAKPFLGFAMFSHHQSVTGSNILVKSFTKRTLEFSENSENNVKAIQKKLADPVTDSLLLFSYLLAILFPTVFASYKGVTSLNLLRLQLALSPREHTYLLNSSLLI